MTHHTTRTSAIRRNTVTSIATAAVATLAFTACTSAGSDSAPSPAPSATSEDAESSDAGASPADSAASDSGTVEASSTGSSSDSASSAFAADALEHSFSYVATGRVTPFGDQNLEVMSIPADVISSQVSEIIAPTAPGGAVTCEGELHESDPMTPSTCTDEQGHTTYVYLVYTGSFDDSAGIGYLVTDTELSKDMKSLLGEQRAFISASEDSEFGLGFYDPGTLNNSSARTELMQASLDAADNSNVRVDSSEWVKVPDASDWLVGTGHDEDGPVSIFMSIANTDSNLVSVQIIDK